MKPAAGDNIDKYILVTVLFSMTGLVLVLIWMHADSSMMEWAKQMTTGVLGALLLALRGKQPDQPPPTTTTMTTQPSGARTATMAIGGAVTEPPPVP